MSLPLSRECDKAGYSGRSNGRRARSYFPLINGQSGSAALLVGLSTVLLSALFFGHCFSHHTIPDVAAIQILSPLFAHCLNTSISLVRITVTTSGSGPSLLSKH